MCRMLRLLIRSLHELLPRPKIEWIGRTVYTHGGHLQQSSDLVHDTDTRESMLSLTEVENGHDGSFLVLWWVSFENLIYELLVLGGEFEGDAGVVIGRIAVLIDKHQLEHEQ